MAKGERKVSISTVDSVINERFFNTVEVNWYDIKMKMYKSIAFTEMLAFVDDVVKSCFQQNGAYVPEVLDFAVRSNIISRYTNMSLPDNLEHRYKLLYNTDIMDFVYGYINMAQVQEIISAINRKLSYMCNTNTSAIQNRLNDLAASFEKMQKNMESLFENLTPDDISKLVSAISGNGFSEEKVVKAYLEQTGEHAAGQK